MFEDFITLVNGFDLSEKIEHGFSVTGEPVEYIKIGKKAGKKLFMACGFVQCKNKNFLENDGVFAHFNTIDKTWHITRA